MNLEFTSTECVRPEITRMGYESFVRNLKGVNFKKSILYLNIDPIPTHNIKAVENVARKFFGSVVVRSPKSPNFCRAVKWCWNQPKNHYFFHLESDWILKTPIKIENMIGILARPKVCAVNLRAYAKKTGILCLSPGLFRTNIIRSMSKRLDPRYNPEQQFRSKSIQYGRGLQPAGVRSIHYPGKIVIVDIGRPWLKKQGLRRSVNGNFNSWDDIRQI